MENELKTLSVILLLFSLAVTGCIVGPGPGYGGHGWGAGDHNDSHEDRDHHGDSQGDHDQHGVFGQ
jgi:hypothetical protein